MGKSFGKIIKGAVFTFAGMLTFTFFEFIIRAVITMYATW